MKEEYITKITKLLQLVDLALLDLIFQILNKTIETNANLSKED
jgi:hypothetical protein